MDRYQLRSFNSASPSEIQDAMEKAEVVWFDRCPVELPPEADLQFMRQGLPRELQVKNISYHPESDSIPRFDAAPEVKNRIEQILRTHGQRVRDPAAMSLITVADVTAKLDAAFAARGITPVH